MTVMFDLDGMVRRGILFGAHAFMLACASGRPYNPGNERVLVINESLAEMVIYIEGTSVRIGAVSAGREECLRLPARSAAVRLYARQLGGWVHYSPLFDPTRSWRWTLDNTRNREQIALLPLDEPCR